MEDMLYDSASMKRFVGISIDEVPDETTLCKFRHFLESHKLTSAYSHYRGHTWKNKACYYEKGR